MKKPRICYVLPLWSGPRRYCHPLMDADSSYYIRTHLEALQTYHHSIDKIVCMVMDNPNPSSGFDTFMRDFLPQTIQGAQVEAIRRKNIGMSYGAFSDCYLKYRTTFDYYLFIEDDAIFPQHDFDQIWLDLLKSGGPRCGFSCSWLSGGPDYDGTCDPVHAGIGCGLFSSKALDAVYRMYGTICAAPGKEYVEAEVYGQVGISQSIFSLNYCAMDLRNTEYRSGFRYANDGHIGWFGKENGPVMVQPL